MPIVKFEPVGKEVEVLAGTELLDAARQAGVDIEAPCGGKGTCGKCIVRIISGKVEVSKHDMLSASALDRGYVLACQSKIIDEAVSVEISEQISKEGGRFIDETGDLCLLRADLLPEGRQPDPLTHKWFLQVPPARLADGLSDLDRLTRAIQDLGGKREVIFPLAVIRQLADTLRQDNGKVTVSMTETAELYHVTRIEPGDHCAQHFGIAVDVGTTTVAVQLVSLQSAKAAATRTAYNEQIDCGLDVISRINYAQRPNRLEELRSRVLKTINHLIEQLCSGNEVDPADICSAAVAGNTTMIHMLLGLKPEYIRLEPYTPTILSSPYLTAGELGIEINPEAWVYISPAVGSYVGGDITAGLLCTDIAADSEAVSLFIDIGTNGELVIGNRDFLVTCACSAGPAFEGGGIDQGMRAALGAIDKVEVDPETGTASYQTIGGVPARGICGSGMISLLANLFLTGWIDAAGKLDRTRVSPAIRLEGRQAHYIVAPAQESASAKAIGVSEIDIENIIRAKAAVYAACSLMLGQVGLGWADLARVYIAGGFGRFLDIDKAVTIGLLPDLPRQRFHYLGNSSLMGAYLVLVSRGFRQHQLELARRMTYIELSTDPAYMDQFTAALFLPHTDIDRFPTVKDSKYVFLEK